MSYIAPKAGPETPRRFVAKDTGIVISVTGVDLDPSEGPAESLKISGELAYKAAAARLAGTQFWNMDARK